MGVKKHIQEDILIIEISEHYKDFIKYILLREDYNFFNPKELNKYLVIKIKLILFALNTPITFMTFQS